MTARLVRTLPALLALAGMVACAATAAGQTKGPEHVFAAAIARVAPSIAGIHVTWKPGKEYVTGAAAGVGGRFKRGTGPVPGLIVSPDGLILTSHFNVNADVKDVKVVLADGREFPAKVLGRDDSRGIQLISIDAKDLPVPEIAKEADIQVGRWALACGVGEKGALPVLSVGIVSATERIRGRAIQTDAPSNPSNYGGPLVDIDGRVMGIITPLLPSGESTGIGLYDSGIGFAVPLEDVLPQLAKMKAGETIEAAFLGIEFDTRVTEGGAKITRVLKDTGADKAGIKPADVIIEFNGIPIHTSFKLLHAIGKSRVGDTVRFKVKRDGKEIELTATLGTRPSTMR